uniref:PiggyBac transposable element-derived protein domain-containing protein n=1 Tax=Acrobeloides nanus TaxID=290746 RepID=A0A914EM88_9BILA
MKRLFDVDNDTHVSMLCELNEPFSTFYESFMSKGLLLNTTNQQWKSIDAGLVFNFTTKLKLHAIYKLWTNRKMVDEP